MNARSWFYSRSFHGRGGFDGKGIAENVQVRILHNVKVVQSRKGWTQAQCTQAIADARKGVAYNFDNPEAPKIKQHVLECGCVFVSAPVYDRDGLPLTSGHYETLCERHQGGHV